MRYMGKKSIGFYMLISKVTYTRSGLLETWWGNRAYE
jgi:hypothetical protein